MDSWKTKYLFPLMGMIPIDRGGGDKSQAALDTAEAVLRRGELFGIFPEGTRSRDGILAQGPHRCGAAGVEGRLPDLSRSASSAPARSSRPTPRFRSCVGSCTIKIGRPINVERYRNRADDHLVLRQITDELMFEIRELTGQDYRNVYAGKTAETEPTVVAKVATISEPSYRSWSVPAPAPLAVAAGNAGRRRDAALVDLSRLWPISRSHCPMVRSAPFAEGATATTVAESIGSRLAKAAVAAVVDGEEWDLGRPLPDGASGGDHHGRHRRGSPCAAPLDGARHGAGRHAAVPRRQVLHRPGHRERLLLRLRSARRQDVQRRRPRRDRGEDARDHQGRSAVRPRRVVAGRGAEAVRRPAVQARDHRACVDGCGRQRRRRRDRRRRDDQRLPQHARVRRPVPRAARAVDGQARPLQADEGRRRVLAWQREGPDAAAHLRHGVGEQGRARRAPASSRGSREARPPQARHRARPAQLPARARRRSRGVASEGRHRPQADGGLQPRAARQRRLPVRLHAAPGQRQPVREVGPPRLLQGRHVPADGDGQRHVLHEADELPDALPDLRGAGSAAIASCRCGCSSSARCTATSGPARCTG